MLDSLQHYSENFSRPTSCPPGAKSLKPHSRRRVLSAGLFLPSPVCSVNLGPGSYPVPAGVMPPPALLRRWRPFSSLVLSLQELLPHLGWPLIFNAAAAKPTHTPGSQWSIQLNPRLQVSHSQTSSLLCSLFLLHLITHQTFVLICTHCWSLLNNVCSRREKPQTSNYLDRLVNGSVIN